LQLLWSITHEIHTYNRFLPRNAAAYALLALALLTVYSQDALAPETHGVVGANMDRSVKPGDDFYHYANGEWIKRTDLPPDHSIIDPRRRHLRQIGRLDPQAYCWPD
jgi:hypothetical protein